MTHEPAPARRAPGLAGLIQVITLAAASTAFMALRILEKGMAWTDRTTTLLIATAIGGACGALAMRAASGLQRLLPARFRLPGWLLASLAFPLGLLLGMGIAFDVDLLVPRVEVPHLSIGQMYRVLSSVVQSFGLFLISVPVYLLPWPLPAMLALAIWIERRFSR